MEKTPSKTYRVQLTELELWILRNLLAERYYCERRNLLWSRKRIAQGEPDSRILPINERDKHQKFNRHLLKKLSRPLNVKWFER